MTAATTSRRITLAKRPTGMVTHDCFAAVDVPDPGCA